tara:strand:- start:911 stop:1174 length:264 start_codon:yes stop_codon:yes gene_type:complete
MPYKDPEERKKNDARYKREKVPIIDNTMTDDTTTRENIMRWREAEYQKFLQEKAEREAKGESTRIGPSIKNRRSISGHRIFIGNHIS